MNPHGNLPCMERNRAFCAFRLIFSWCVSFVHDCTWMQFYFKAHDHGGSKIKQHGYTAKWNRPSTVIMKSQREVPVQFFVIFHDDDHYANFYCGIHVLRTGDRVSAKGEWTKDVYCFYEASKPSQPLLSYTWLHRRALNQGLAPVKRFNPINRQSLIV